MATFRIDVNQLENELAKRNASAKDVLIKAAHMAAERGRTHLMQKASEAGKVDRGIYKNAWKVTASANEVELVNDAPYAGIIERGARPHNVNAEGVAAISGWVRRKLGVQDEKEVNSITWAIINKLKTEGQKPTYIVRDALEELNKFWSVEIENELRKLADMKV